VTSKRSTPLYERHAALGARLVDFAGWEMPLQYTGIIAEHNSVREDVGLFDVSHLGKLRVRGAQGGRALQHAVTAEVLTLAEGRARYALVLNDDGGCIDDIFVYRIGPEEWLVVPNAANVMWVARAIEASGGTAVDEWDRWAILALQGPRSFDAFESTFPGTGALDLKLHAFAHFDVFSEDGLVARTGYTGEPGFEIYAPARTATKAFDALLAAGAAPVGLGARDTLRLEMGYALYGHELQPTINPLEAGLGWAVSWDKDFRGRAALERVRERGTTRASFAVRCSDKGVPRQGYRVLSDGVEVGIVTSGNHSPTLGCGIALALGPKATRPEPGKSVHIEARGRLLAGDIVAPPFVERGRKLVDK
jgi:aminomethyltransferase